MVEKQNLGLGSWPWRRARITPERVALSMGERSLTYAALANRSARLAAVLAEAGVGRGDRVAYLGANHLATFEALFAAGLLGAVFVPLNTRLSAPELCHLLDDSAPAVLVRSEAAAHLLGSAASPRELRRVLVLREVSDPEAGDDYEAAVAAAAPLSGGPAVTLEDAALILYTSGTTGRPKGAVLTHGNLTWNTMNQLAHADFTSNERALCIAPLFHVVGLGQVTLPTLFKGGRVEVLPRFDAAAILALIERQGITSFAGVPTMLQLLCEHPDFARTDLRSLTCVIYGGSPVPERVARAWLARGVQLLQGYGMTEASPGVYMAVPGGAQERPVSIGVPHFFTDVAHLDGARPVPVQRGAAAELVIRGPNVFKEYWRQDSRESWAGGWFRTGDVVAERDEGWAYVIDRVKDLIISGGENVSPAEVEAVLGQLDAVLGCAVVAVPDERWGEVGAAFLVLRPGATLAPDVLRQHLEQHLARYKIPRYIHFLDELPRNAAGKVRRAVLRASLPAAADADGAGGAK